MTASKGSSRRHVGFGGHQLAEYCLGAALAVVGLHLSGRTELVLVASGGVLGVSALVSKGPLAAWRIVPRRLHLYLDFLLAVCFALSPLLYLPGLPVIPIVISEAVAVVLVRMSLTTEIVPRPRPERSSNATWARRAGRLAGSRSQAGAVPKAATVPKAGTVSQAPSAGRSSPPPSPLRDTATPATGSSQRDAGQGGTGQDAMTAAAAAAAQLFGAAVAKARDSGAPLAAARRLGRATGHARRIGRAAAAAKAAPPDATPTSTVPRTSQPAE
jgi:hypothetical protein